jgi:hypothetical protein
MGKASLAKYSYLTVNRLLEISNIGTVSGDGEIIHTHCKGQFQCLAKQGLDRLRLYLNTVKCALLVSISAIGRVPVSVVGKVPARRPRDTPVSNFV